MKTEKKHCFMEFLLKNLKEMRSVKIPDDLRNIDFLLLSFTILHLFKHLCRIIGYLKDIPQVSIIKFQHYSNQAIQIFLIEYTALFFQITVTLISHIAIPVYIITQNGNTWNSSNFLYSQNSSRTCVAAYVCKDLT